MDAMDDQRIGDIDEVERGQLSQEDATPAAHDHLLAPGKQQSHEDTPTRLPVMSVIILGILMFLPLLIIVFSFPGLISSGQDPLGFSFLAFLLLFSLVPCGLGITLFVRISPPSTTHGPPFSQNWSLLTNTHNLDGNIYPDNTELLCLHGI